MYNKNVNSERKNSKTFRSLVLSVSLIIAGAVFAPQTARAGINPPNVQTNTVVRNSVVYICHIEDPLTPGQDDIYIYSPSIILSQGLTDDLRDVLTSDEGALLPSIADENAQAQRYFNSNFNIAEDTTGLVWSDIPAVLNWISPFKEHNYTVDDSVHTSYSFLTSSSLDVVYVYIDAVLTPITIQTLNYDNVDIFVFTATLSPTATQIISASPSNPLRAWVENGTLHVSGLTAGEAWNVYNAAGQNLYQSSPSPTLPKGEVVFPSFGGVRGGIYIIKQGNNAVKVVY